MFYFLISVGVGNVKQDMYMNLLYFKGHLINNYLRGILKYEETWCSAITNDDHLYILDASIAGGATLINFMLLLRFH